MSKRKILILATALCMVAILAVGGTLAYFTDDDFATNVFTVGNIDIRLDETFSPEDAKLIMPGQDVEKIVHVENVGANPAFVRVHVALPKILDSGDPDFAAYANTMHWNFSKASFAEGLWNWNKNEAGPNYPGNGGNWNAYETTIDGVEYTVYVATYETALAAKTGKTAEPAINNVYLDTDLTQEEWNDIKSIFGDAEEIKVLVAAEGVQTVTFEEAGAYVALNTAFGTPGTTGYVNPWARKAAEDAE